MNRHFRLCSSDIADGIELANKRSPQNFSEEFINSKIENKDEIKDMIKNCMRSYPGNWVLDAFDEKRMKCICSYIKMKFDISGIMKIKNSYGDKEDVSHEIVISIYRFVLKELSQIDIKPYGE